MQTPPGHMVRKLCTCVNSLSHIKLWFNTFADEYEHSHCRNSGSVMCYLDLIIISSVKTKINKINTSVEKFYPILQIDSCCCWSNRKSEICFYYLFHWFFVCYNWFLLFKPFTFLYNKYFWYFLSNNIKSVKCWRAPHVCCYLIATARAKHDKIQLYHL